MHEIRQLVSKEELVRQMTDNFLFGDSLPLLAAVKSAKNDEKVIDSGRKKSFSQFSEQGCAIVHLQKYQSNQTSKSFHIGKKLNSSKTDVNIGRLTMGEKLHLQRVKNQKLIEYKQKALDQYAPDENQSIMLS